jgi:uncharacterized iron-regulated membrane protein
VLRAACVLLHRWVGLALAAFLIVLGLTGATLAFLPELNRWLAPDLFPGPHGVELDAPTLIERAQVLIPKGRVASINLKDIGAAAVAMEPRSEESPLDFDTLYLDSVTGAELGRIRESGIPNKAVEITPFVCRLHSQLAAGEPGGWLLGIVALIWTIDCFIGFYLTLPMLSRRSKNSFFARWKTSWLVKRGASCYRFNFDLHRAGGLWLWGALLLFAWSGVYMDLNSFYTGATRLFLDYEQPTWARPVASNAEGDREPLDWRPAYGIALRLTTSQSQEKSFSIGRAIAFYFMRDKGLYEYIFRSNRDIGDSGGRTTLDFDAYTGAFKSIDLPTRQRSGTTLTTWLVELHTANILGYAYKIFVSIIGIFIVISSVTGIYIWWQKRWAKQNQARAATTVRIDIGC